MRVSALALALFVGAAHAQESARPFATSALASGQVELSLRVSPQLVDRIGSPSVDVRTEALQTVCALAYDVDPGVDVRPAIPALLDVFRTEPDWRLQISALRALEAIGDGGSMAALRRGVGTPMEPPVRRLLFFVLLNHYGVDEVRQDPRLVAMARAVMDHDRRTSRKSAGARLVADR